MGTKVKASLTIFAVIGLVIIVLLWWSALLGMDQDIVNAWTGTLLIVGFPAFLVLTWEWVGEL